MQTNSWWVDRLWSSPTNGASTRFDLNWSDLSVRKFACTVRHASWNPADFAIFGRFARLEKSRFTLGDCTALLLTRHF